MPPAIELPTLAVTAKQAAAMFSMSVRNWHRMNSAGQIPAPHRLNGCVRWDRNELERWWAAGAPTRATWEQEKS